MRPDEIGFAQGFCIGLLVPFGAFVIRWIWGKIQPRFKPQVVVHVTKKTPLQVLGESIEALLIIVAVSSGVAVTMSVRPDLISTLRGIVSRLAGP